MFVTDKMVQRCLAGPEHKASREAWEALVLQSWWHDDDSAEAFLARGNRFLRDPDAEHSFHGVSILEAVVETVLLLVLLYLF